MRPHGRRTEAREPDLSCVIQSAQAIAGHVRLGQLVILQSTTYPGTTRQVVQPILESGDRPFVKRLGKVVPMSPTPLTEEQVRGMIVPHLTLAQVEDNIVRCPESATAERMIHLIKQVRATWKSDIKGIPAVATK